MRSIGGHVALDSFEVRAGGIAQCVPVAGVIRRARAYPLHREVLTLAAFPISVLAANDFGSAKVCDLPTRAFLFMGAVVNLTSTLSGFTSNAGSALDLALGTVATASTTFANAGEKDLLQKLDGAGAGSPGTVAGVSDATAGGIFKASAARSVFINVSDPVAAGTGSLLLSGTIELVYGLLG